MRADGLGADQERIRDVPLLETICKQAEDLPLPGCQGRHDRRLAGKRSLDQLPGADEELVQVERLGEIVIGPDQKARHPVQRVGPLTRHQNDGNPLSSGLLDLVTDLITRYVVEANVEER